MLLSKKFYEAYPEFKEDAVKGIFYLRHINKNPFGVVIIDKNDNIGWSLVNEDKGDKWDKIVGIRKALYRCEAKRGVIDTIKYFEKVSHTRYFRLYKMFDIVNSIRILSDIINKREKVEAAEEVK